MAREYEGEIVFVGVSNNDTVKGGKEYMRRLEVPYALGHSPDVWELYEVPYQPVTIVIDPEGRIAHRTDGPITYAGLKEQLEALPD